MNTKVCLSVLTIICLTAFISKSFADEKKEITLKDGRKVFRIEVGSESDDPKDLKQRVRDLERAVRELQEQCYPVLIQKEPTVHWTCRVGAWGKKYYGEGETKGTAEREAMEACQRKGNNGMHCMLDECFSEDVGDKTHR